MFLGGIEGEHWHAMREIKTRATYKFYQMSGIAEALIRKKSIFELS